LRIDIEDEIVGVLPLRHKTKLGHVRVSGKLRLEPLAFALYFVQPGGAELRDEHARLNENARETLPVSCVVKLETSCEATVRFRLPAFFSV